MGGTISVTIIEQNGDMHKMQRWTNNVPAFIKNVKFITKDSDYVKAYLDRWLPLKSDWEKNGPDGPFEYEGTTDFFPSTGMTPDEYGILVIDFQKDKIYAIQDYVELKFIRKNKKENDAYWQDENDFFDFCEEHQLLSNYRSGAVKTVTYADVHLSPFELIEYDKSAANLTKMMNLLDAEYGLTVDEKNIWLTKIDQRKETEREIKQSEIQVRQEVWSKKEQYKKRISKTKKPIIWKEEIHPLMSDLLREISEEMELNVVKIDFMDDEKERAFHLLKQGAKDHVLYIFEALLFLEEDQEVHEVRKFISNMPPTSKVILAKEWESEKRVIQAIIS